MLLFLRRISFIITVGTKRKLALSVKSWRLALTLIFGRISFIIIVLKIKRRVVRSRRPTLKLILRRIRFILTIKNKSSFVKAARNKRLFMVLRRSGDTIQLFKFSIIIIVFLFLLILFDNICLVLNINCLIFEFPINVTKE